MQEGAAAVIHSGAPGDSAGATCWLAQKACGSSSSPGLAGRGKCVAALSAGVPNSVQKHTGLGQGDLPQNLSGLLGSWWYGVCWGGGRSVVGWTFRRSIDFGSGVFVGLLPAWRWRGAVLPVSHSPGKFQCWVTPGWGEFIISFENVPVAKSTGNRAGGPFLASWQPWEVEAEGGREALPSSAREAPEGAVDSPHRVFQQSAVLDT